MRFPKMQGSPTKTYVFPSLDAGLNVSTAPHLAEQAQLTDANNMWWEQNHLTTRPGVVATNLSGFDYNSDIAPQWQVVHTGQKVAHEDTMTELVYGHTLVQQGTRQTCKLQFYKLGGDGLLYPCARLWFSGFATDDPRVVHTNRYPRSIFVYKDTPRLGCGIYLLCINQSFLQTDVTETKPIYTVYEFSSDMLVLYALPQEAVYAPTVYVNGRGDLAEQAQLPTASYPLPQRFEELNYLTGRFCMLFTTDGLSTQFSFPIRDLSNDGVTKITYTDNDGNQTLWEIAADSNTSNTVEGAYAVLDRNVGRLQLFLEDGTAYALPQSAAGNNLHISTWKSEHVYGLTLQEMCYGKWIEDAPGLTEGGNRLFLAGNPTNGALLAWCQANRPLYFPLSNTFTVGEVGQSITALAKQGGKLVVFKEHSVYAIDYSRATAYPLQAACSGQISNVKSDIARMKIFQVHDSIGCDCPGTIQPCFDRLVWASTDRRVYVLVTSQGFASAHVYELSEMIRGRLMQVSDACLRAAFAINWRGKYVLFAGERQFVLSYGKQGFRYINSYTSEQAAQKNISWYAWSTSLFKGFASAELVGGFFNADQCVLLAKLQGVNVDGHYLGYLQPLCLQGEQDSLLTWDPQTGRVVFSTRAVEGFFQTAYVDFGSAMRYKRLGSIYITAHQGAQPLRVSYCTEQGCFSAEQNANALPPDGVYKFTPRLGKLRYLGLRLACKGAFGVSGILVQYKPLGHYK